VQGEVIMAETTHKILGGSVAGRIIQCPASVEFNRHRSKPASAAANEGTRAHALLETCLKMNASALTVPAEGADDEMRMHIRDVLKFIRKEAVDMGGFIQSEVSFDLQHLLPVAGRHLPCGGTTDVVITSSDEMTVLDLKYGMGVPVSAAGNPQLRFYAMGALMAGGKFGQVKTVNMVILQPRAKDGNTVSADTIPAADLWDWWVETFSAAVTESQSKQPRFCTGAYCQFCPGMVDCPEHTRTALEAAQIAFDPEAGLPAVRDVVLPCAGEMSDTHLRKAMDLGGILSRWIKGVEAEVSARLSAGKATPETIGYKFVEGNRRREWVDNEKVEREYSLMGAELYEPAKLKTPAALEKTIKEMGGNPRAIDAFVVTTRKPTLVPASDKRQAINAGAEMFEKESENE